LIWWIKLLTAPVAASATRTSESISTSISIIEHNCNSIFNILFLLD
jgi:hypothetical protein